MECIENKLFFYKCIISLLFFSGKKRNFSEKIHRMLLICYCILEKFISGPFFFSFYLFICFPETTDIFLCKGHLPNFFWTCSQLSLLRKWKRKTNLLYVCPMLFYLACEIGSSKNDRKVFLFLYLHCLVDASACVCEFLGRRSALNFR